MRYAIFSDIHNHTEALKAVLQHAHQHNVDGYFCLGDIGIDECVALVRSVNAPTVFGNWEVSNWRALSPQNRGWILNLPPQRKMNDFWLTHAAPLWPEQLNTLNEVIEGRHSFSFGRLFPYLHQESDLLWDSMAALTEAGIPLMFHGHTHRQIIWRFTADNQLQKRIQPQITIKAGETFIVGVGSVGYPLDGQTSYVIYDDASRSVEMIRVAGNF
ncbi:MAG: metallophosphoesterase family protein [Anaerolineae bacterium]|nr:metallophosphoesterase family protein [Anaerolineae bacterium]